MARSFFVVWGVVVAMLERASSFTTPSKLLATTSPSLRPSSILAAQSQATTCQGVRRRVWHMINLTNGLELLQELIESGHQAEGLQFCRIQSSHCEARDFEAVLRELDHNMLLRLALGDAVIVHDCGSRGLVWPSQMELQVGKAPSAEFDEDLTGTVPRAIWWGLEWVRFVLRDIWQYGLLPSILLFNPLPCPLCFSSPPSPSPFFSRNTHP